MFYCWPGGLTTSAWQTSITAGNTTIRSLGKPTILRAGMNNMAAINENGHVLAWGGGDGLNSSEHSGGKYVYRPPKGHKYVDVSPGRNHMIALDDTGQAWTWGANDDGQLGDGSNTKRGDAVKVTGGHKFKLVAAGQYFTAALDENGQAWTWGHNFGGQLGNGSYRDSNYPVKVTGGHKFTTLTVGSNFVVALDETGHAWSWGYTSNGRLGRGTSDTPQTVPGMVEGGHKFATINAQHWYSVIGVDTNGQAWAWGDNSSGHLGAGEYDSGKPVRIFEPHRFTTYAPCQEHTIALDGDGQAWIWGGNQYGAFGENYTIYGDYTAGLVKTGLGHRFRTIECTQRANIGTDYTGKVWVWGSAYSGCLGSSEACTGPKPMLVTID